MSLTLVDILKELLHAFTAIFFIMNPIGAAPIFCSLTADATLQERKAIARKTSTTAFVVLVVFMLMGSIIFRLFNFTIEALRIAGGIIIFIIALNMIHGKLSAAKLTQAEQEDAATQDEVAVIPLGTPLLSGPGAITKVMVLESQAQTIAHHAIVFSMVSITCLITYFILNHSVHLVAKLGNTGIKIMTRIMGLILAAIAVQFVLNGVYGFLPKLLKAAP